MPSSTPSMPKSRAAALLERFRQVRAFSERLVRPLCPEDCVVQSMPDVSPTRWHLAHVTWFFETFVLKASRDDYRAFDPDFEYLFNSYYNAVGDQFPRPRRGLLTRPALARVLEYRGHVDERMERALESGDLPERLEGLVELGLHHEQQHQELLLMDIKHVFSCNPLYPAYDESTVPRGDGAASPAGWVPFPEGLATIGHEAAGGSGFAFDHEGPRHRVFLPAAALASRLVTNAEYLEFIEDGAYRRPQLWLADGWATVRDEGWHAPLYWVRREDGWMEFGLDGLRPLESAAPVSHVSYYEADAYARWAGARLPSEAEWERAAVPRPVEGNFVESSALRALPARGANGGREPEQIFGDLWEWTSSAYAPYPGFRPSAGAVGEYNGKFMCNQYVLRGGCCTTSESHIRPTYRNFFYPGSRWMFSGIRLARDEA